MLFRLFSFAVHVQYIKEAGTMLLKRPTKVTGREDPKQKRRGGEAGIRALQVRLAPLDVFSLAEELEAL